MNTSIQTPHYVNLYKEFDTLIKAKNYAGENTYQYCIRDFMLWLESQDILRIKKVESSDVIRYYEYLLERPNKRRTGTLSASYVNQNLFSLRMFFDYLLETDQIKSAVVLPKYYRKEGKSRNIITQQEATLLFDSCVNSKEKALLSLAYGCGLRRTEIQKLNVNDINLASGILVVKQGKGRKRREIPVSDSVIRYLKNYLIHERTKLLQGKTQTELAFILGANGNRMQGEYLNLMLQDIILRTENRKLIKKELTLHCLRHSIAAHLIDNGASIEFVRDFLGHSRIDTAHLYARRRKRNRNINLKYANA